MLCLRVPAPLSGTTLAPDDTAFGEDPGDDAGVVSSPGGDLVNETPADDEPQAQIEWGGDDEPDWAGSRTASAPPPAKRGPAWLAQRRLRRPPAVRADGSLPRPKTSPVGIALGVANQAQFGDFIDNLADREPSTFRAAVREAVRRRFGARVDVVPVARVHLPTAPAVVGRSGGPPVVGPFTLERAADITVRSAFRRLLTGAYQYFEEEEHILAR